MSELITPAELALFHASWQAALLAIAVAALCRWMPGRIPPHLQFILWGIVFARLALPVLPASQFSAQRLLGMTDAATAVVTGGETDNGQHAAQPVLIEGSIERDPSLSASPLPSPAAGVPVTAPADKRKSAGSLVAQLPALLFTVWLLGLGALCLRYFLQWRRLERMARPWQVATDPSLLKLVDDSRQTMRIRRPVQLLRADPPVGPALLGLFRPRIVLPKATLLAASDKQLQMLLLHEMSHIRRCDVLWDHLARILVAIHWFNPAAWWALARLREAREQACDAAVLRCVGLTQGATYGRLILSLAEQLGTQRAEAVLVGATGSIRSLQRRIEMIGTYGKTTRLQSTIGVMAILALVLCGLTRAPARNDNTSTISGTGASGQAAVAKDYEISGICTDENEKPIAGVRVRVFRMTLAPDSIEQVSEMVTTDQGTFSFKQLPPPELVSGTSRAEEHYITHYNVVAQAPGLATRVVSLRTSRDSPLNLALLMKNAGKLSGRITDEKGQPVEGAAVYVYRFYHNTALDGVMMDVTDANGRYEITDLMKSGNGKPGPEPSGKEGLAAIPGGNVYVQHPHFGTAWGSYRTIPSQVDIAVQPAATVEGVVIDQVTGKPFADARVYIQGLDDSPHSDTVQSDAGGHYRITSLAAGKYNVICKTSDRTSIAIDSLQVEAGQVYERNFHLIEGSWIEGRVIDALTGAPVTTEREGRGLQVAVYGPAYPRSGAAVEGAWVGQDGRFGLRVAPGRNYPYIMNSEVWQRTEDQEKYREGIDIGEGELVSLEFRVLPERPRKKPEFSPVRLAIPVAEERDAAAAVRRLGGWYDVDQARHVVKINMVYHETKEKVRYKNEQTGTDEILQWLPQFPQLKQLFLTKGQATDDGLRFVSQCPELEAVSLWDAQAITDAGIEHLRPLKWLKRISVTNSLIGDASMEVFGTLPELESLSLQGNRFTDAGVAHLAGLKSLKRLAFSSEHAHFTNEVVRHVAKLTNLESLDLQEVPVTDAGIRELAALTNLKKVYIGGAPSENTEAITDASVKVFAGFSQLETVYIHNCRLTDAGALELAALSTLKELHLDATHLSDEVCDEIKSRYPEKRFSFARVSQ